MIVLYTYLTAIVIATTLTIFFHQIPQTTFVFQNTTFNHQLKQTILESVGNYHPPWYYNLHLGSLIPLYTKHPNLLFERKTYFHQQEELQIDWFPKWENNPKTIILYLPGLGLTSKNFVVQQFVEEVTASSSTSVICGILLPKTSSAWNAANTKDLLFLIHNLSSIVEKKVNLVLVGFSASSNIVMMTVVELHTKYGDAAYIIDGKVQLIGAFCVCVNYDYVLTRSLLESKTMIGKLYSRLLSLQFQQVHGLQTRKFIPLSEYDERMWREYGFERRDEFESRMTPKKVVVNWSIPMVLIQPQDDPLYLYSHGTVMEGIPMEEMAVLNPNVFFILPKHGNHFGFLGDYKYPARVMRSIWEKKLVVQTFQ